VYTSTPVGYLQYSAKIVMGAWKYCLMISQIQFSRLGFRLGAHRTSRNRSCTIG